MAAPTFVAQALAYSDALDAQLTIARPSGVTSGDEAVMVLRTPSGSTITPPSGWTLRGSQADTSAAKVWIYTKTLGASEPTSYTSGVSGTQGRAGGIFAYRNASYSAIATASGGSSTSMVAPTVTSPAANSMLLCIVGHDQGTPTSYTAPGGMTGRQLTSSPAYSFGAADQVVAAGATGTRTFTASAANDYAGLSVVLAPTNTLPNAPTLSSPTGGTIYDRSEDVTLTHVHSDPDSDAQVDAEHRYRILLAAWTTVTSLSTATTSTITGGTAAAGDYEWQARTSDSEGFGAWSASAYFTLADAPAAPVITAPADTATVTTASYTLTHTHADSPTSMQVRVTSTDGLTTHYDSGVIAWATSHEATLFPLATNGGDVLVESRVKKDGIWSTWDSHTVTVDYTPPAEATAVVDTHSSGRAIVVVATHPTPAGGQPTVTSMDVERQQSLDAGVTWTDEAGTSGAVGVHVGGQGIAPGATLTDWLVASGTLYRYRVVSYADDGTSSTGDWT